MADVTVVAAEVLPDGAESQLQQVTFGATITAGQAVYLDSSASTWKLADANLSAAAAAVAGIAMSGGAAGQAGIVCTGGTLDPGFTVDPGAIYVLSGTAGGIAPAADLAAGMYSTALMIGITASKAKLLIPHGRSGVQVPA
jgi:hypothetical protein